MELITMKKSILFTIDSLDCAGAEKSLVTLLNLIDFDKFSVDLMLFAHGNVLEELVPKQVNILDPIRYTKFSQMNLLEAFTFSFRTFSFKFFAARLKYSIQLRLRKYSNAQKARLFWENISPVIEENNKSYDIAISYAQGIPTFYVSEKVKAKRKFAWVNVSYRLDEYEKKFQKKYYDRYHQIVAVSHSTKDVFLETFPEFKDNIKVIYDINDPHFISSMANIGGDFEGSFDGIKILTIGRLAHQKGYDIALNACQKLKERGVDFKWYVLGKGPLKNEIEKYIEENDLSDHFILLGVKTNPYPYIKNADIYVQTSKFEGFGLAIAEARMLNTPVVTTRFDAVYNQMIDGQNGLVVDMNADAVCEGVLKIINDQTLRRDIIDYLQNEKKGNVEEVNKFYSLVGS
jgi:glycosyltransferase involved in cell wall biosynthesis